MTSKGGGVKDFVTTVTALMLKKRDDVGVGQKLRDVIYGQPLSFILFVSSLHRC